MTQAFDDSEDEIIDLDGCTLTVFYKCQDIFVDSLELLNEALHNQMFLFFIDILVKQLVVNQQNCMFGSLH